MSADNKTHSTTGSADEVYSLSVRLPLSGQQFEGMVALRTLNRAIEVLEQGAKLGFGWPTIGSSGEGWDRAFARLRALRDELQRARAKEVGP